VSKKLNFTPFPLFLISARLDNSPEKIKSCITYRILILNGLIILPQKKEYVKIFLPYIIKKYRKILNPN
jgi:hypothetical protein